MIRAEVPGSKSITNRALLMAAMAEGKSVITNCMASEDATVFLNALKTLGFQITQSISANAGIVKNTDVTIQGLGGKIPVKAAEVYVGSAGTAARFLLAMLAFSDGEYILTSSEQMKKRPMQPLIDAVSAAGARIECMEEEGHFPLRVLGCSGNIPDHIAVDIKQSSQFLSALLIAAAVQGKPLCIEAIGEHGLAYVEMTRSMLADFAVNICREDNKYIFDGSSSLHAREYAVEPDMSAAAYFYALGAILGREAAVPGVKRDMLQGDGRFLDILKQMGCDLYERDGELVLRGPEGGRLKGLCVDMSACSDQALTLAAIAPFADGVVEIHGISHIRLQECDRIAAIVNNLSALGISCEELADGVRIIPGEPKSALLESYGDHRVAMSFALTAARCPGIEIKDKECCRKTFAEYFEVLAAALA